ncbi:MAG: rhodanese-like domain-containing protein [Phycisphaerales bacterium]|jgi:3-mercaptopyruvate sulfurtransferase SseA
MPPTGRKTSLRHDAGLRRTRHAATVVLAATAGFTGCNSGITDADIENISLTEVRLLWLEQREEPGEPLLILIDPRRRDAFEQARLPGALHVTLPDIAERTRVDPSVARFEHIVVYAEGPGALSGRAMTKRLLVLGYDQARLFGGGVIEWSDAGFPVASGEPENEPARPQPRDVRRPVP